MFRWLSALTFLLAFAVSTLWQPGRGFEAGLDRGKAESAQQSGDSSAELPENSECGSKENASPDLFDEAALGFPRSSLVSPSFAQSALDISHRRLKTGVPLLELHRPPEA